MKHYLVLEHGSLIWGSAMGAKLVLHDTSTTEGQHRDRSKCYY